MAWCVCWHHAWIQDLCCFSVNTWQTTFYSLQSLCQKYNMLCYQFHHIKETSWLVETDSSPNSFYRLSCICSQCFQQEGEGKKDRPKGCFFYIFIFFNFKRSSLHPQIPSVRINMKITLILNWYNWMVNYMWPSLLNLKITGMFTGTAFTGTILIVLRRNGYKAGSYFFGSFNKPILKC